jgi:hypothetical protein
MTCKACDDFIRATGSSEEKIITNISVSSNNVCTITCINHGLSTGDTIYVYESNSVAIIDGYWTVQYVDNDTFQIRTSQVVTAGDSGKFQFDVILDKKCIEVIDYIPGGYTYCGCYCENCCPPIPIYETFYRSLYSPCMLNGYDITVLACNATQLRITGDGENGIGGGLISDYSDCTGTETIPFSASLDFFLINNLIIKKQISDISVGNPTIITTTTNHGLKAGDLVDIENSDSVPSIDGVGQPITVIDNTRFSIDIEVTSQGSQGDIYYELGITELRSCEHLKDRYQYWYDQKIQEIENGDLGAFNECEEAFIKSLLPSPETVLQYFCCYEIKREISFEAGSGKCCLDQGTSAAFTINNKTFTATGNLNVIVETTILEDHVECLYLPTINTAPKTSAGPCNIGFTISYTDYAYLPNEDVFGVADTCCSQIVVSKSSSGSPNVLTASLDVPNCDDIFLGAFQAGCGEGAGSDQCLTLLCSDPTTTCDTSLTAMQSVTFNTIEEEIIENGITYINICSPEPTPAYWSGTLRQDENQQISVLQNQEKKSNGLVYFNNQMTRSIDKIYLSKQNYLNEKRNFKFEDWNGLGQTKKTHLKIKYGKNKIICIFKITDEIREFDDFYEIPVKFVYGKLPPDGILINLEFILPSKTTSHLTKINKLEILKRIKRRRT